MHLDFDHSSLDELNSCVGDYGLSALMICISKRRLDLCLKLVNRGVDLGARDDLGRTALHHAASSSTIMSLLLENGVDVSRNAWTMDALDNEGHSPLSVAAEVGRLDVVGMLVARGAVLDRELQTSETCSRVIWIGWTPVQSRVLVERLVSAMESALDNFPPRLKALLCFFDELPLSSDMQWIVSQYI